MAIGDRDGLGQHVLDRRELLAGMAVGALGTGAIVSSAARDVGELAIPRGPTQEDGHGTIRTMEYFLPAVDASGCGTVVPVTLQLREGGGGILVDLEQVEVRHDVQLAVRESLATAQRLTGQSMDSSHVRVSFGVENGEVVSFLGKSWEAGLTVALVGQLRDRSPGHETLITGIVADDGTLLPVGGLAAKARAARETGATRLLVPEQSLPDTPDTTLEPVPSISTAVRRIFST